MSHLEDLAVVGVATYDEDRPFATMRAKPFLLAHCDWVQNGSEKALTRDLRDRPDCALQEDVVDLDREGRTAILKAFVGIGADTHADQNPGLLCGVEAWH
jgi:hypothetical protein